MVAFCKSGFIFGASIRYATSKPNDTAREFRCSSPTKPGLVDNLPSRAVVWFGRLEFRYTRPGVIAGAGVYFLASLWRTWVDRAPLRECGAFFDLSREINSFLPLLLRNGYGRQNSTDETPKTKLPAGTGGGGSGLQLTTGRMYSWTTRRYSRPSAGSPATETPGVGRPPRPQEISGAETPIAKRHNKPRETRPGQRAAQGVLLRATAQPFPKGRSIERNAASGRPRGAQQFSRVGGLFGLDGNSTLPACKEITL